MLASVGLRRWGWREEAPGGSGSAEPWPGQSDRAAFVPQDSGGRAAVARLGAAPGADALLRAAPAPAEGRELTEHFSRSQPAN